MSQATKKAQILHLVSSIELPNHTMMAGTALVMAVDRLSELQRQAKLLSKMMDAEKDLIKEQMGNKTHLVDSSGLELVTWKYNKDSEKVDTKRLKEKYPDVYNQVAELVAGSRVFNVTK